MSLELIAVSSQKRTTVNHELNATERTSLELIAANSQNRRTVNHELNTERSSLELIVESSQIEQNHCGP